MTAREELENAMSRCKISRRRRSTRAARGGERQWCWETARPRAAREANTTRLDDAEDK